MAKKELSEEIKGKILLAKKDKKKDDKFLYELAMELKPENKRLAMKFFKKAAKLKNTSAMIEIGLDYMNSSWYYGANYYFLQALNLGDKNAQKCIQDMRNHEANAKKEKERQALILKYKPYNDFVARTTLSCCPECGGKLEQIGKTTSGRVTIDYFSVVVGPTTTNDKNGQTITTTFKCNTCGFSYERAENERHTDRKNWKEEKVGYYAYYTVKNKALGACSSKASVELSNRNGKFNETH